MPKRLGTVQELYRLREARRSLERSIEDMEAAGLDAMALRATYGDLINTVILLPVPCIICKRRFPEEYKVAGEGWPYRVLCADCNDEIEEGVKQIKNDPEWQKANPGFE